VARAVLAGLRAGARFGLTWRREEVNGQPGALLSTARAGWSP
jgi:hypothetical protein